AVAAAPVDAPSEQAPEPEQDESRSATDQIGDDIDGEGGSRRRRRGGRGRRGRAQTDDDGGSGATPSDTGDVTSSAAQASPGDDESADAEDGDAGSSRRRRRRRRGAGSGEDDPPGTVTRVREVRSQRDEPTAVKGSTRLEAKKQRRREGREAGRRRTVMTEAEFLSRRESVDRVMVVRGRGDRTQIGVLEDGVLVEHYVSRETTASMAGNVYLGRVQNVLPSMEAAFVDIGKGRNAVLYAGEVNWDAAGLEGGQARRIEHALKSGDTVLVQVTKDPIGHKGARLTSQISLPGRYVVYVPEGSMTGISRKLPDTERARLKGILKEIVPDSAGVIVRTAAEGASEEELTADVERLTQAWEKISAKAESAAAKKAGSGGSPMLLHGEPDLTVRVIRDVFTEDFSSLVVSGEKAWSEVSDYVQDVAPDLAPRLSRWTSEEDVFASHRIDEQIAKAMDRKVWLPSGGSLVIDRTEAMTVVDVNTGKFIGSGGNLEAAEEIVRQLRLRDIGGIIVVDFIDMVLEANRDLVVRRLLECLGRDRTKHQVAEVTSLGLVQMTRKRVGSGLIEVFSEPCEHCNGSGVIVHTEPIDRSGSADQASGSGGSGGAGGSRPARGRRGTSASGGSGTGGSGSGGSGSNGSGSNGSGSNGSGSGGSGNGGSGNGGSEAAARTPSGPTAAQIAAAAHAAALRRSEHEGADAAGRESAVAVADAVADAVVEAVSGAAPARSENHDDVSSVPEAPAPEPFPEPVADAVVEPVVPPVAEPVTRARRKRGRVVAPAGPPRPVGDADGSEAADGASETESPTA
ncbi:MAG: Rne/Rng family ribonuclease, partial [Humibacillus sp.]